CQFCGGDNPGFNEFCSGCGSPKDPSKARAQVVQSEKKPEPVARPPAKGGGCLKACLIAFVVMLVLIVGPCMFLTGTSDSQATITAKHWQRSIQVEKLVNETDTDWQNDVPPGAKVLKSTRKLRETRQVQTGSTTKTRTVTKQVQTGTRKVKTGTKDLGNGYFEDIYKEEPVYEDQQVKESYEEPTYRDEPVYDNEVTYQIDRWKSQSKAEASGSDDSPRWPEVATDRTTREGPRTEAYSLSLKAGGKDYTYEPKSEVEYQSYKVNQTVTATINRMGTVTELKP
ncbi:MAG: hypothetical protein KC910_33385, partial [Candidatus Eremiobacteraeota bacterium]|nr:hypothetical protein [Candidatus Eremiobacteraeota bacterium]